MKLLLKLEELALFILSIYLFAQLPYRWWIYPLLLLAPDLSFLGFVAGKHAGVIVYDLFHHKAVALVLIIAGGLLSIPAISLAGIILLGHGSLDRVMGYGLREFSGFDRRPQTADEG